MATAVVSSSPPRTMVAEYTHDRALEDIPGSKHALELFLASHMAESEKFCLECDPKKERLYCASGYGLIQCVKALMSFEDEDLTSAISHTKHANFIAQQHRKKTVSLTSRIAGFVVGSPTSGVSWVKSMTPVERHAELIYAETLFQKALLGIVYSGDWLAFIKEALNLRTTFTTYRLLYKFIVTMDTEADERREGPEDKSIDRHFRSGVLLGAGMSNIILSLMPSRLLTIVELFGFKGDRMKGLGMLYEAGGWGPASLEPNSPPLSEPLINAKDEGLRRSICDMSLLVFHLILSSATSVGVDVPRAQHILEWNLKRYPEGVFFLFGKGRLSLIHAKPHEAIESYKKAMTSANLGAALSGTQIQKDSTATDEVFNGIKSQGFKSLGHLSLWEMAIAHFALWELQESLACWRELEREATWSKACYAYGVAACLIEINANYDSHRQQGNEKTELSGLREAQKLLAELPNRLQRIAGKSIPLEKFVARKARKFKTQDNRLFLPALEYAYFFLVIARAPRSVVRDKMLREVREAQQKLENHLQNPEGYEGGHGFWDDYCLASFLEGVCERYLAYPESNALEFTDIDKPESPLEDKISSLNLSLSIQESSTEPRNSFSGNPSPTNGVSSNSNQHIQSTTSQRNDEGIKDAATRSEKALLKVLEYGTKIELDHYLVYYAHFELGRLYSRMNRTEEGRLHFDLVLSGKPLEVSSGSRKGKYSLESALLMQTHASIEALDHCRGNVL